MDESSSATTWNTVNALSIAISYQSIIMTNCHIKKVNSPYGLAN